MPNILEFDEITPNYLRPKTCIVVPIIDLYFHFQVETQYGETFIVSLIKKFRNNIGVISGTFVITEPITGGKKVKAEIVRILTADLVKKFYEEGLWPSSFSNASQLDNTYEKSIEREKDMDHMKNVVSNRHLPHLSSRYVNEPSNCSAEATQCIDEDLGVAPNPNIRKVSRFVSMDDVSDDEDEGTESYDEDTESEDEDAESEDEDAESEDENDESEDEDAESEDEDDESEDEDAESEDEDDESEDEDTEGKDDNTSYH